MNIFRQPVKIASLLLILTGIVLIGLNIYSGGKFNLGLPMVFLMLGGMFFILSFMARENWKWAPVLYIPGGLMLAFGLVFLLNVLTDDWQAWAYAWLLLVSGLGVGMALANRELAFRPVITPVGWGMAAGGVTLSTLFGAIASGPFIQALAPILLVLGGLALFLARPEAILPERVLERLRLKAPQEMKTLEPVADQRTLPNQSDLVEPLSARELEVLLLIDQGLSNQQIAAKLSIAESTVKTHINNIYGKLGVETRVQAIRRARELLLF